MTGSDLMALIKRAVELCRPDLRHYYRMVRKARVVKTYQSDGSYWADVQPLRNDESVDEREPVISRVEIPILWGGRQRGVVCPPEVGTYCDLSYYDGDPNYPRISNFRWHVHKAPQVEVGGFIIQREPGTHIKIDAENNIIHVTPADMENEVGGDKKETVDGNKTETVKGDKAETIQGSRTGQVMGDLTETVGRTWTITAVGAVTIAAPVIALVGNLSCFGAGGAAGAVTEKSHRVHEGSYSLTGPASINGDLHVSGNITCDGDNPNHHEHEDD